MNNDWVGKHYSFFENRECECFPCHKWTEDRDFNCLFCYCPLYFLKCGGNYKYTESGIKDCSDCLIPHRRENYGYILDKFLSASKGEAKMKVSVKLLTPTAKMPVYSSESASGADLCADIQENIIIAPGETVKIPCGISVELPNGYAGLIYARSGLSVREGLAPANKVGVIDSDYRGEIIVALYNQSGEARTVTPGERIAQLVVSPAPQLSFEAVDSLSDTERGTGGFGSTGK